jgi:nitrite reductase (NADH) small subunit
MCHPFHPLDARLFYPPGDMSNWIRVAAVDDFPPGQHDELVVGERIVALFRVEGQFYALDGICPHQGGPLGKGEVRDCIVTCPWHGWQFDLRSGQHQANPSLRHQAFPVRVEGNDVFVDLDG